MEVRIVALSVKGEEALRKYIQASNDIEASMKKLSIFHPKRLKFEMDQKLAKKFITEESLENPLMIVAKVNTKYDNQAMSYIPIIEKKLHSIMMKSNCGKEDYNIEVM